MANPFFSQGQATDPFYNRIRDNTDRKDARDFVEELWQRYEPYAEPDFLNDARKDFHAKTWEMYLGCLFLGFNLNLQKKTKKEGSDLHLLWNNRSIWVEATAPESGTGANAVPDYKFNEVSDQPVDQIILRLTSAIQKKFKKYKGYIDKDIIKPDDFFVIAINGGRIRHAIAEQHIPYVVKSVLPFGNLVLTLRKDSVKVVDSNYEYRDTISTAKGSPVATNIFENMDYTGISAVLYLWMNIVNHPNKIGVEVHLVHNPLADNKLPLGIFRFGTEWWVEGDKLIRKSHTGGESNWNSPEREKKLFFCQIEAVETIIYLTEVLPKNPKGITIPPDLPVESDLAKGYKPLKRYGCKMATGSGKTIVMAMLAAWSVINKAQYRQDKRFSDAVLIVCPNLTIRERLSVLYPSNPNNYYAKFDIVPTGMMDMLAGGKFFVTNWHSFLPVDDSRKKSVIQRGVESEKAFCNRVLKELSGKENILVFNDEAHHAYRPAPFKTDEELQKLSADERKRIKEEEEEATVWIGGLDKINFARKISLCVDLSATPFYIQGSGYPEGSPFPWLVSDFGLVDAIECGIVKIPRVPVDDNSGQPIPKYFRLWENINKTLPASERATQRRKPKPESVFREAEGALATLASEWKKNI